MQKNPADIAIFLVGVILLVSVMMGFLLLILNLARKKHQVYEHTLQQVKLDHEKNLMAAQLEIQEQTFTAISREIHDNINLSLTLAKLHLNTLDQSQASLAEEKIKSSIHLVGQAIHDLSTISQHLNADKVVQLGLTAAIEDEINQVRKTGIFNIHFELTGTPCFMDSQREVILFRIIQESFNNIIKHAGASEVKVTLHFSNNSLQMTICDNGCGIPDMNPLLLRRSGLRNMELRTKMLQGTMFINSKKGDGTALVFTIPTSSYEIKQSIHSRCAG